MSNVLLIGSEGFTGRYLVKTLLPLAAMNAFESCKFGLDLRDPKSIVSCLRATRPDIVVNLAAISAVSRTDVRAVYEVNAFGMLNLLETLREADFCGRLVFASSANIYGRQSDLLDESTCPRPVNHYGVSKAMAESYCGMFSGCAMKIVIVRPFNCIGSGQAEEFLVAKIVRHFREKRDCIELGNVNIRRDFSDIRDVAEMYRLVVTAPEAPPVIQFCSGITWSIQEIIAILEKITGRALRIELNPALARSNDLMRQQGSRALLDQLGHKSKYSMEDTLRWMYESAVDAVRSNS
jgi:nucleoside-diphosphate-sugar epimerase